MADQTANSTVTVANLTESRAGLMSDTCGQVITRNYKFTVANGSFDSGDTISLGLAPEGCTPVLALVKPSANLTASATLAFGLAEAANGTNSTSALVTAGSITTAGYSAAIPANTVAAHTCDTGSDRYLVVTGGGANNTANATIEVAVQFMAVDTSAGKFSTFDT